MFDAFIKINQFILGSFNEPWLAGISFLVWLGGVVGFILGFWSWKNSSKERRNGLLLLTLFTFGIWFSIARGGPVYPHYHTQLIPFMSLASAIFLDILCSTRVKWMTIFAISLAIILFFQPIIGNYNIFRVNCLHISP